MENRLSGTKKRQKIWGSGSPIWTRSRSWKAVNTTRKIRMGNQPTTSTTCLCSMVSTACRATTSDIGKDRTDKLASSVFSITPTVFYAKQANENDLSLQPALLLGFLDDILSIGPG